MKLLENFVLCSGFLKKDHVAPDLDNVVQNIMQDREFLLNDKGSFQYCIDYANCIYSIIFAAMRTAPPQGNTYIYYSVFTLTCEIL